MTTYGSVLDALGDPTRRALLELVADRPRAVGELARALPVSRPAVSQHLKVLTGAGLVQASAAGTRRIYRLDPRGVAAVRAYLDRFWDEGLDAYSRAVADDAEPHAEPHDEPHEPTPEGRRP